MKPRFEPYEDIVSLSRRRYAPAVVTLSDDGIFAEHLEASFTPNQEACLRAERQWLRLGKPYFKVDPDIAAEFADTSIDIESRFLELPFESFVVQLPANCQFDFLEHFPPVRGLLISWAQNVLIPDECRRAILLNAQFNKPCPISKGMWFESDFIHSFVDGVKIEERFQLMVSEPMDSFQREEEALGVGVGLKLLRIAVCTAFMAMNSGSTLGLDFTHKKRAKYEKAKKRGDEGRMQELEKQFAGKYRITREVILPHQERARKVNGDSQPGKPYEYARPRRAHLRRVAVGPRNNPHHEIRLIPNTIARPDLPFKESGQNYRFVKD